VAADKPAPRGALGMLDLVATIVLAIVGALLGLGYGGLAVLFVPDHELWFWWALTGVALGALPLVTAVLGFIRLSRREVAFWVPLLGLLGAALLVGMLTALSGTIASGG
jgi:hypothetical protein